MRRKMIVGLGTAVTALAVAGIAYAAVNVTFSATLSPNKANKPTGAEREHRVHGHHARRVAAADHEPHRDQVRQGRQVQRAQVPALQARVPAGEGPEGLPERVEDRDGHRHRPGPAGRGGSGQRQADAVQRRQGRAARTRCSCTCSRTSARRSCRSARVDQDGQRYTLDFNIPPIKTLPSAPDASVVSVKTKTPVKTVKKGKRKYYLIIAPKKCSGTWKGTGHVLLRDRRDEDRCRSRRSARSADPTPLDQSVVFLGGPESFRADRIVVGLGVRPPESSDPRLLEPSLPPSPESPEPPLRPRPAPWLRRRHQSACPSWRWA